MVVVRASIQCQARFRLPGLRLDSYLRVGAPTDSNYTLAGVS